MELREDYQYFYKLLSDINCLRQSIPVLREQKEKAKKVEEARIREKYQIHHNEINDKITNVKRFLQGVYNHTPHYKDLGAIAEPDFTLMRVLYDMIDPASNDDSYAANLARMCNGAVIYLEKQDLEISEKEKKEIKNIPETNEIADLESRIQVTKREISKKENIFLQDMRLKPFAHEILTQAKAFSLFGNYDYNLPLPTSEPTNMRFGVVRKPFPVSDEFTNEVKQLFSVFYDFSGKMLRLPIGFKTIGNSIIRIIYPDGYDDQISRIITAILFNILRNRKPLSNRVLFLDPVRRNSRSLGVMESFVGDSSFIIYSPNTQKDEEYLRNLMKNNLSQHYLFLRGFPENFGTNAQEMIRNICHNKDDYKVTIFSIESTSSKTFRNSRDNAAFADACVIEQLDREHKYITLPNGQKEQFEWFTTPDGFRLSDAMINRFKAAYLPKKHSTNFFEACSLPDRLPYKKGVVRKNGITLPLGYIDGSDTMFSAIFNRQNSFGFLMGAAGSGKSILLHILITGIIIRYHPDDIELWLADFGRSAFLLYKDFQPPHLKYLLLENSSLYCFSFIDTMWNEMRRRQELFAKHSWRNIVDVPAEIYLPHIFILFDEFGVVSDVISGNDIYQNRLREVVTNGSKYGFRIIFSNQVFSGVTGIIKKNLNIRMAMYTPHPQEINDTIDVQHLSEEDKRKLQNIKVFHVLYKQTDPSVNYKLDYVENFFVTDDILERNMGPWIRGLKTVMKKSTSFDAARPDLFVEKHPHVIDGIAIERYTDNKRLFSECIKSYFQNSFAARPTDKLLFPGNPCGFEKVAPIILKDDEYQNMLIFCDYIGYNAKYLSEVMASLLRSAMDISLPTEVWAEENDVCIINPQTVNYWKSSQVFSKAGDIRQRIHDLKTDVDSEAVKPRVIGIFNMPKLMRQLEREQSLSQRKTNTAADAMSEDPLDRFKGMNRVANMFNDGQNQTENEFNVMDDFFDLLQWGPKYGIHFIVNSESNTALNKCNENYITKRIKEVDFPHVLAFRMKESDTVGILDSYERQAKRLPANPPDVFLYTDRHNISMFIPYDNQDFNGIS